MLDKIIIITFFSILFLSVISSFINDSGENKPTTMQELRDACFKSGGVEFRYSVQGSQHNVCIFKKDSK